MYIYGTYAYTNKHTYVTTKLHRGIIFKYLHPIPVDNTEMSTHSSTCKTDPICTHDQEEKQQSNNSVPQDLSEGDDTVSG